MPACLVPLLFFPPGWPYILCDRSASWATEGLRLFPHRAAHANPSSWGAHVDLGLTSCSGGLVPRSPGNASVGLGGCG